MLTLLQADGLFEVLLEELDVDPACRELLVGALRVGAERVRFSGFSSRPERERPRLLLVRQDLEHIRCPSNDQEKLDLEARHRVVRAGRRIADLVAAPAVAPVGTRSRLSDLAA